MSFKNKMVIFAPEARKSNIFRPELSQLFVVFFEPDSIFDPNFFFHPQFFFRPEVHFLTSNFYDFKIFLAQFEID
jgi:hypothetical protein